MTSIADPAPAASQPSAASQDPMRATGSASVVRVRDPRLDFFRGIAMFIILCAHTPGNFFTSWIPARWGFSDATEIFVFCSGAASAIAFGASYANRGWWIGTMRVSYRIWQVYWAHIGTFFALASILAAVDMTGRFDKVYIGTLNLWKFFAEPGPELVGLFTLTYVPNYFDILPMYMVILALMPAVMALSRIAPVLIPIAVIGMWLLAQGALMDAVGLSAYHLALPAEPWSDRQWYFNPFGWQLLFFTGFAFSRGWLPAPPISRGLMILAAVVVVANVPLSNIGVRELGLDWARDWRVENRALFDKSDFGVLRYLHFLALAYLCWALAGDGGHRLRPAGDGVLDRIWQRVVTVTMKVGQQSLAVFVFSMVFARLMGLAFDVLGRGTGVVVAGNLIGFAALIAVAYTVALYKSQPWRKQA